MDVGGAVAAAVDRRPCARGRHRRHRGEDPGQEVSIPLPVIDQDNLADNVRPDMPDSLWLPTDLPDDVIEELLS